MVSGRVVREADDARAVTVLGVLVPTRMITSRWNQHLSLVEGVLPFELPGAQSAWRQVRKSNGNCASYA